MRVKEAETVRCLQCGWVGPTSQLKPLKPLKTLKQKDDTFCICPKCGHVAFEKITEESEQSELSEG